MTYVLYGVSTTESYRIRDLRATTERYTNNISIDIENSIIMDLLRAKDFAWSLLSIKVYYIM